MWTHPTINEGEMRLALTSGYSLDVKTPLPEPHLSPCLPFSMLPSSSSLSSPTSIPLLPSTWGPVEVIYISVKRLEMTLKQESPGPWHWMLRWRLHEVHGPGATINVKCNKRPVNKIEHCQSHSLLIDCPSRRQCLVHVCVCQWINPTLSSLRIKSNKSWIS